MGKRNHAYIRGFRKVTRGFREVTRGFREVTRSLREVTKGLRAVTRGLSEVTMGLREVTRGLIKVARGLREVTSMVRKRGKFFLRLPKDEIALNRKGRKSTKSEILTQISLYLINMKVTDVSLYK